MAMLIISGGQLENQIFGLHGGYKSAHRMIYFCHNEYDEERIVH